MNIDVSHIPIDRISTQPILYTWDDWDPYEVIGEADDDLIESLANISYRAAVTFAIGCAEWTIYRFKNISDDPIPYLYLEACWAYIMTDKYIAPAESEDDLWKGPIRGVINLSLMTVLNSIYGIEDESPETEAAFSDKISLHVLNNDKDYIFWRNSLLTRLESHYPKDLKSPIGSAIPREVINPNDEFQIIKSDILIDNFIRKISQTNNPFLEIYTG